MLETCPNLSLFLLRPSIFSLKPCHQEWMFHSINLLGLFCFVFIFFSCTFPAVSLVYHCFLRLFQFDVGNLQHPFMKGLLQINWCIYSLVYSYFQDFSGYFIIFFSNPNNQYKLFSSLKMLGVVVQTLMPALWRQKQIPASSRPAWSKQWIPGQ